MLDKVGGDMVRPRLHLRPPKKAEALDSSFEIAVGQGRPLVITVAAVVVTRNRPALLKRCLDALDSQTYPASQVVVIDNASDQPTRDLLALEAAHRDSSFHPIRLEENTGGAGGFHAGMDACLSLPCSHVWLMDDDCEPDSQAIAELVAAAAIVGEDAVLGGNIVDLNDESVNVQSISQRLGTNCVPQYPLHLAEGLLEVSALTFVSFLVSIELVRKVGLPLKEFFIWGDDTEYSRRLARFTRLYQVGKSKTKHLKSGDGSQSLFKEQDRNKIPQYYWLYRNRLFVNLKYDGLFSTNTSKFIFRSFRDVFLSIRSQKFVLMKCRTIIYGLCSGIAFAMSTPKKEKLGLLDDASLAALSGRRGLFSGSAAAQRTSE
jgi:GT2 family glycosyltransferase